MTQRHAAAGPDPGTGVSGRPDGGSPGGAPGSSAAASLRGVELLVVVALWAFFAMLNVATGLVDPHGLGVPPAPRAGAVAGAFVNPAVWAALTALVVWPSRRFSLAGAFAVRRVALLIVVGVLVANASDAVADALWDAVVPADAAQQVLGGAGRRFRPGLTNLTWLDDFGVYLAALAAGAARGYILRERQRRDAARHREGELEAESVRLQADAARLQAQLAEARLDALRRQLDPHFLFNTLHAVSALVERDPRGVRRMVGQLSDLLRHSMDDASTPEVPLRQELALLDRYLDIMRVRFDDQLVVETRADPRALDALVPNLILQPLVENAIRHGVEQRAEGGRVEVEAALDGDTVVLRVRDDGPGMGPGVAPVIAPAGVGAPAPDGARAGVGLRNTVARLAQLYGADCRFVLGSGPDGGTVAEVRLPYHTRPVRRPAAATAPGRPGRDPALDQDAARVG